MLAALDHVTFNEARGFCGNNPSGVSKNCYVPAVVAAAWVNIHAIVHVTDPNNITYAIAKFQFPGSWKSYLDTQKLRWVLLQ